MRTGEKPFVLFGVAQSYFTRKMSGYLDYKGTPGEVPETLVAVLERAGILRWFADHTGQAGATPKVETPPRPALNQPFPATP